MYSFSRSIYRELAPHILEDERHGHDGPSNHERVLRACESAIERLATDWHYFAKPTKTLFGDVRIYFPLQDQMRVYKIVDRYMRFAKEYFATRPATDALPAHAAPAQRLLPVPPASRRDRAGRPARSLTAGSERRRIRRRRTRALPGMGSVPGPCCWAST
jgi:hypothetical protein